MGNYETILFDLDGTLIDSSECITSAVQYSLKSVGISEPNTNNLLRFIGPPLRDSYKNYYSLDPQQIEYARESFRNFFIEFGIPLNSVYQGIPDLLWILRTTKAHLLVATTKPKDLAEKVLQHLDLLQYFEEIIGGTETGTHSTKSGIIKSAIQLNPRKASTDIVMVGDYKGDIIGANDNKIDSIAVTYGFSTKEELLLCNPTHTVESVSGLRNLLLNI